MRELSSSPSVDGSQTLGIDERTFGQYQGEQAERPPQPPLETAVGLI
jgi:hypothetical protein